MKGGLAALRVLAVGGVLAAIADPGCARPDRPRLEVAIVGEVADQQRREVASQVRRLASWADVVDAASAEASRAGTRVLVGDAAPVLFDLRARPAVLAARLGGDALEIAAVQVPSRVPSGSRVPVTVLLELPPGRPGGVVRVRLVDAVTGREQATAEGEVRAGPSDAPVSVPWLAVGEGPRRLRVQATPVAPMSGRPSPWVEATVDVLPAAVRAHLLEARPTWVGRFTRLALASSREVALSTDVRTAPGLAVQRQQPGELTPQASADVLLVSGVEALTSKDVDRLAQHVRDAGRALVLLLDEPPGPGAWRRLWPGDLGRVVTADAPRAITVAGVAWRAREWLSVPTSTAMQALAYVDEEQSPVVVARTLGAGRVVLVAALDAWRWRGEPGVSWASGWQALVRRLAADVPPPVGVTAWPADAGTERLLHVDARIRGDLAASGPLEVQTRVEAAGASETLTLVPVQEGRWRGALRTSHEAPHRVTTEARNARGVVGRGEAVVHVSPIQGPASWRDVVRHQQHRGSAAAGDAAALARELDRLRDVLVGRDGPRWYLTRTWWYAALVIAALGTEWILRRARRLP